MRDSRVKGPHPRVTFFSRLSNRNKNICCLRLTGDHQYRDKTNKCAMAMTERRVGESRWFCGVLGVTNKECESVLGSEACGCKLMILRTSPGTCYRPEGCPSGLGGRSA